MVNILQFITDISWTMMNYILGSYYVWIEFFNIVSMKFLSLFLTFGFIFFPFVFKCLVISMT
jgi:hypothetical protein